MDCRSCGAPLMGDERACPACLAYVDREPALPRPQKPAPAPATAAAIAVALEAPLEEEVIAAPKPCPAHPSVSIAGVCGRCGTFICRECDPRAELPSARCAACRAREEAGPVGIGGWLVLPAIWCVVGPLLLGGTSAFMFYTLTRVFSDKVAFHAVVMAAMTAFISYASVQFFRKKASVPGLMILWLVLQCIHALLFALDEEVKGGASDLLRGVLALAIWGPYFLLSKRVKATFVR